MCPTFYLMTHTLFPHLWPNSPSVSRGHEVTTIIPPNHFTHFSPWTHHCSAEGGWWRPWVSAVCLPDFCTASASSLIWGAIWVGVGCLTLLLHQWGVNSDVKQQRESAHRLQMRCLMHFQRRANESIWKRWWLQKREREKDGREAAFTVTRRINRSRKKQTNTRSQTFYFKTTSLRHFLTEWNILVCCFIAPLTLNVLV